MINYKFLQDKSIGILHPGESVVGFFLEVHQHGFECVTSFENYLYLGVLKDSSEFLTKSWDLGD